MFKWLFKKTHDPTPPTHMEKAIEYQQVAGLLCLDIDVLVECCTQKNVTKEDMLWQIKDLQQKKNDMIKDRDLRESRYQAAYLLAYLRGK